MHTQMLFILHARKYPEAHLLQATVTIRWILTIINSVKLKLQAINLFILKHVSVLKLFPHFIDSTSFSLY